MKKTPERELIERMLDYRLNGEARLAMFSEERRIALEAKGLKQFGAPPRPPMSKRH